MSYPKTGSMGTGYRLAQSIGHKIISTFPSLGPLEVVERQRAKSLQGLSLKNVEASAFIKKENGHEESIVTRGGIDLKEINPKTMASKIKDNIYFLARFLILMVLQEAIIYRQHFQQAMLLDCMEKRFKSNENSN